jgi:hypothetical protein
MRASEARLAAVFRCIDITPPYPVSLLGYFNDRRSEGVLDPLRCRLAAFRASRARGPRASAPFGASPSAALHRLLLVQIDTCLFDQAFAWGLRRALRARGHGAWRAREVLVFASHTHTAPALARLYEPPRQDRYAAELTARIAEAAGEAARALAAAPEVAVTVAGGGAPGLSFNRRWRGADGKAVTNPSRAQRGRLAGPEGPVDPELLGVWFRNAGGAPLAAFVSAVNHTDTVGGQRISADWPGFLERELGRELGANLPVFFLPGAQGNINHFDPATDRDQTCYEEAARLGRAYARAVLDCLPQARPLPLRRCRAALGSSLRRVRLPGRRIPPAALGAARASLAAGQGAGRGRLTASELAAGSPEVTRVLARELLRQAPFRRRAYRVPLQAVWIEGLLLCGVPGEMFVELGLALKAGGGALGLHAPARQAPAHRAPARQASPASGPVVPLGLAGPYYGYILPGARLPAGGYEALPASGCLGGAAGERIVQHFRRLAVRPPS